MNTKDIQLVLQAKLEEGDALQKAQQMGSSMAQALERAFDGLGERVADRFFHAISSKMASFNINDFSVGRSRGMVDQFGTPIGSGGPTVPPGGVATPPSAPTPPVPPGGGSAVTGGATGAPSSASRVRDALQESYQRFYGPLSALQAFRTDPMKGFSEEAYSQAISGDVEIANIRAFQSAQKINPSLTYQGAFGDGFGDKLKNLRSDLTFNSGEGLKDLGKLADSIKELRLQIEGLKQQGKEGMDVQKDLSAKEAELAKAIEGSKRTTESITALEKSAQVVARAEEDMRTPGIGKFLRSAKGQMLGGAMLGVAGQALDLAGNYNIYGMQAAAGRADIAGFSSRDFAAGDYGGLIGTAMAGGEEKMRQEAAFSSRLWAYGKMGVGAAGVALGAFSSAAGVGIPLALGGAGVALSGVTDIKRMEKLVAENMREQQNLSRFTNKEFADMYGASRSMAVGSFRGAQALGSTQLSDFLYGGGVGGMRSQLLGMDLTNADINGSLANIAGTMGGAFGGRTPAIMGSDVQAQLARTLGLKGQGFSNVDSVAAMMFQGSSLGGTAGSDRANSLKQTEEMFTRAVAAGMDRTQVSNYLSRVASMASGLGTGGSDIAQMKLEMALGASQGAFGSRGGELAHIQTAANIQERFQSATMGRGNDLGTLSGYEAVTEFLQQNHLPLSFENIELLRQQNVGAGYFERKFKYDPETAKKKAKYLAQLKQNKFLARVSKTGGFSREMATLMSGEAGGSAEANLDAALAISSGQTEAVDRGAGGAASGVTGQAEGKAEESVEAVRLTEGFKTLRQVLPIVNTELDKFIRRMNALSRGGVGAVPPR